MRPPAEVPPLRPRPADSHKGMMGRLLIVGGSPGLTGAVVMAASAALRSGVGLVTCAVPKSLNVIIEVKTTEAMSVPLPDGGRGVLEPEALPVLRQHLERSDAVIAGPGAGRDAATRAFHRKLLSMLSRPHLIDADGLWHLAQEPELLRRGAANRVITPHDGEMRRLCEALGLPVENRPQTAARFASTVAGVLVWKGHSTLVIERERRYENHTGNPGMATGGSGDVLSGIIGAFLARGDSPYDAAVRGTWVHGRAGDLAAAQFGEESLIATDIISCLPEAFLELRKRDSN